MRDCKNGISTACNQLASIVTLRPWRFYPTSDLVSYSRPSRQIQNSSIIPTNLFQYFGHGRFIDLDKLLLGTWGSLLRRSPEMTTLTCNLFRSPSNWWNPSNKATKFVDVLELVIDRDWITLFLSIKVFKRKENYPTWSVSMGRPEWLRERTSASFCK